MTSWCFEKGSSQAAHVASVPMPPHTLGMGARGRNFYNDLVSRYGYEGEARRIQDLYLAGKKEEAAAAVPDALVDEIALCGPKERIRERLEVWKTSGITTLICGAKSPEALRLMAELAL